MIACHVGDDWDETIQGYGLIVNSNVNLCVINDRMKAMLGVTDMSMMPISLCQL